VIYWRTMSFFGRAALVLKEHRETIARKDAEIGMLQQAILQHQLGYIDIVAAWRVSLEQPEVDLSEDLDAMLQQLRDNVAQTQEYVV